MIGAAVAAAIERGVAPPLRVVRRWAVWRQAVGFVGLLVAATVTAMAPVGLAWAQAMQRPSPAQSGLAFAGPSVRALQADDFANPGMLWVERGQRLWSEAAGPSGRSCAGCHADGLRGAAARLPAVDAASGQLVNLESRIRACQTQRQGIEASAHESDTLLALSAYVAHQSRGLPQRVDVDGPARAFFDRGRDLYQRRVGQLNLACGHCHDLNWGRRLGPETISQGHGVGYPAYRLEWQALGSLHRRFRSCLSGVRAEMLPQGHADLLALELFLAWRSSGLPMEAPAVRR
jgi:sulfur-oxidizing protein SoxA